MHCYRAKRKSKGLTLIELVVVIVILAVLSAIAIPTFLSIVTKSKYAALETTAHTLADDASALAAFQQTGPASVDQEITPPATYVVAVETEVGAIGSGAITVSATSTASYTISKSGISVCLVVSTTDGGPTTVTGGACSADPDGQTDTTGTYLAGVEQVAEGGTYGCAVTTTGHAYCWGLNGHGQLGDGTYTTSAIPVEVSDLSDVYSISVGANSTCAVTTAGHAYCWGWNTTSAIPVEVSDLSDVRSISVNYGSTCAVTITGHAYCWGNNRTGQLGNGTYTTSDIPVEVKGPTGTGYLFTVTQISAGFFTTCAVTRTVTTGSHAYCWGNNAFYQLGDGNTTNSPTPVEVSDLSDVYSISVGVTSVCATTDSHAYCWGTNYWGQLGDGTTTPSDVPVEVSDLSDVRSISVNYGSTCAVTITGHAYCWGYNGNGELGDGTVTKTTPHSTPVEVSDLSTKAVISAGANSACVRTTGSHAYCWGSNNYGQLGDGTYTTSAIPVEVLAAGSPT